MSTVPESRAKARVPISIEVAMTEIDALYTGVTKLLEAVARLEEGAKHRSEQDGATNTRLSLIDSRLLHVERSSAETRTAVSVVKWLFATSIAVGGIAVALLSIYT